MRMEAVHRKLLLYVGQRSSDQPIRAYHDPPPSAFQSPLMKCDAHDLDMSINSLPESRVPAMARSVLDLLEEEAGEALGASSARGVRGLSAVWLLALVLVVTQTY